MLSVKRFTPTGVGTMRCERSPPTRLAVHPHGRGDNSTRYRFVTFPDGSPPRAWGQFGVSNVDHTEKRFTPTGVGTIRYLSPFSPTNTGSPPRAWGQSSSGAVTTLALRFTPTGVGTISGRCARSRRVPVHPHGRGDNRNSDRYYDLSDGSPPRAWGQSAPRSKYAVWYRFTPTGVGTIASAERR